MKIFKLKINSSVLTFNSLAIVVALLGWFVAFVTDNMDFLRELLTIGQMSMLVGAVNVINIILRVTNVKGLKPFEIEKPDK